MASDLFKELTSRLSLEGVDIDNWTWKFYSRVSAGIFFVAAVMSVTDTYTGEKITCMEGANDYDKHYCWLHGTKHLDQNQIATAIQNGETCFSNGKDEKVTSYYLWVSLVLVLSAILFLIPNELWKFFEGGMLAQFGSNKQNFVKDAKGSASNFKMLSNNQTQRYFFTFVIFEAANFVMGILIFLLTDWFLDGQFSSYGIKSIDYLRGSLPCTEVDVGGGGDLCPDINPMCSVFPTTVRCEVISYGANGEADISNHICVLGQNIMNQKIYLILSIWFMILFSVSACSILCRVLTTMLPVFQRGEIQKLLLTSSDSDVKKLILDFNHIGNYFVLTQIGKNATPYNFREFMKELVNEEHYSEKEYDPKVLKIKQSRIYESNTSIMKPNGGRMHLMAEENV